MIKIYVLKDLREYSQDSVYYVLSYIKQYSSTKFTTHLFTLDNIDIENSENNYIFFAFASINFYTKLIDLIYTLRKEYDQIKINIVLGGVAVRFVDIKAIQKHFPEINFIVLGQGEDIAKQIVGKKLPPGLYDEKFSHKIAKYQLEEEYYNNVNGHLLTFNGNRCSNRCKFCQNGSYFLRESRQPNYLIKEIKKIRARGHKKFFIYDNYLDHRKFIELLSLCLENKIYDIKFNCIGAHVSVHYKKMYSRIKNKWEDVSGRNFPLQSIGLGVEFYSQEVLDKYNKGTTLYQIDKAVEEMRELNFPFSAYIIHGLPGVSEKSFQEHKKWIENHSSNLYIAGISYFNLSKYNAVFNEIGLFGIKLINKYTTNDYYKPNKYDPVLETEFYNFLTWNDEEEKYLTQYQVLEKYEAINYKCRKNINLKSSFLRHSYKWKRFNLSNV